MFIFPSLLSLLFYFLFRSSNLKARQMLRKKNKPNQGVDNRIVIILDIEPLAKL